MTVVDGTTTASGAYTYDNAGRQTQRVVDGVTEDLTWDVSSNLVASKVTDGTHTTYWTYLYDASGQRWAKIERPTNTADACQATVYVGDTEVTDTDTSTNDTFAADGLHDVTATRYFTFSGATVAVEQGVEGASSAALSFLFGDYQGSAQLLMPDLRDTGGNYDLAASAAAIQRNAYTPYGADRSFDPDGAGSADANPLTIEHGWLNQVADETTTKLGTGLTYLNARYYDPATARFVAPDPIRDLMDPTTFDSYGYSFNNPIFFNDANGMWGWSNITKFAKDHAAALITAAIVTVAVVAVVATAGAAAPALMGAAAAVMDGSAILGGAATFLTGASVALAAAPVEVAAAASGVTLGTFAYSFVDDVTHSDQPLPERVAGAATDATVNGGFLGSVTLSGGEALAAAPNASGLVGNVKNAFKGLMQKVRGSNSSNAKAAPPETAPSDLQTTTAKLQAHVDQAVKDYDNGAIKMSPAQARAAAADPGLKGAYRGQVIDSAVKNAVRSDPWLGPRLYVTRSGEYGPDFYDPFSHTWWDVTTRNDWWSHVFKYAGAFGAGVGVFTK